MKTNCIKPRDFSIGEVRSLSKEIGIRNADTVNVNLAATR